MSYKTKKHKPRIRQNIYGNWNGYLGTRKVREFGTSKTDAYAWLRDQVSPRQTYGDRVHPGTGEVAPEGHFWVMNLLSGDWALISDRTPYSMSVASESYWCN